MPDGTPQVFRRVLLKISGEALMGDRSYGLDPNYVARVADEVKRRDGAGRSGLLGGRWR